MIIALAAARVNIGAICVSIVLYDMGQQLCQISSSYRIAGIDPKARARLNGCYLLCVFAGQVSPGSSIVRVEADQAFGRHRERPSSPRYIIRTVGHQQEQRVSLSSEQRCSSSLLGGLLLHLP